MVQRNMPEGRAYCIDATEVTIAQYDEFLAEASPEHNLLAQCAGNAVFQDAFCASSASGEPTVYPAHCVDWCDAAAYCEWAGKRLCEFEPQDFSAETGVDAMILTAFGEDPSAHDEWQNACSASGSRAFAYGDDYDIRRCEWGRVDSPGCADVEEEVFGLSGNAGEWVAPCLDTQLGLVCPARSRHVFPTNEDLVTEGDLVFGTCDGVEAFLPEERFLHLGIRCCADPSAVR
jgi:formylglycine-generating enzyme